MKKIITTILIMTLVSMFAVSCNNSGFSFYDLGGTWKNNSGATFTVNTSSKTITKGNTTYKLNGDPGDSKAQMLNVMLLKDGSNAGSITFTSKTEAKGDGDFAGNWNKN